MADDICKAPLAVKSPAPTRKQGNNLQAAILAALRRSSNRVGLPRLPLYPDEQTSLPSDGMSQRRQILIFVRRKTLRA
jgi:hypothetical protein